jgi:hypothetical protein
MKRMFHLEVKKMRAFKDLITKMKESKANSFDFVPVTGPQFPQPVRIKEGRPVGYWPADYLFFLREDGQTYALFNDLLVQVSWVQMVFLLNIRRNTGDPFKSSRWDDYEGKVFSGL